MASEFMPGKQMPKLNNAAVIAQTRNTLPAKKRSDTANKANIKVPVIKPACTALVK
jgi:hypothetical protein